jgi:dihydrolipoamide dehydrogenase
MVELERQMLPGMDAEVAEELRKAFVKRGVTVLLGHGYQSLARSGNGWNVALDAGGSAKNVEAEAVLVAVGRGPISRDLGLDQLGIELERGGFIKIDDSFRTSCASVYAIGDVARPPLLAHKASAEGVAAVEIMAGVREPGFDPLSIPACIYCEPEVASIGLSEADARTRGIEVKVGRMPFRANGKAVAVNQTEGFVKIVASKQYGEVIGCQIVGHHATDLISEVVLGKTLETTTSELGRSVHPHPTLSEAIMEAALAADGEAINF